MTRVDPAGDAEIDAILGWTHGEWGGGLALDAYRARTRAMLDSAWGRANYRFHLARDAAGEPVAACKAYRLAVTLDGRPGWALGFGAVFTRPERRREGHAARMLAALADGARAEGAALALLFSDIGPAYYAGLGYVPLGVTRGRADALPGGEAPFRPAAPGEVPAAAWRRPGALALGRDADAWAYLLARNEAEVLMWTPAGADGPRGFVAIDAEADPDPEDGLWIHEAGWADDGDAPAFWADVRRLAAARGMATAQGWLPASAAAGGFALTPLEAPMAMARPLNAALPARSDLWSLDHF